MAGVADVVDHRRRVVGDARPMKSTQLTLSSEPSLAALAGLRTMKNSGPVVVGALVSVDRDVHVGLPAAGAGTVDRAHQRCRPAAPVRISIGAAGGGRGGPEPQLVDAGQVDRGVATSSRRPR